MFKTKKMAIFLVFLQKIKYLARPDPKTNKTKWCEAQKGRVEVVLPDGTRCDCVTDTHAIEFDFGNGEGQKILDPTYQNH